MSTASSSLRTPDKKRAISEKEVERRRVQHFISLAEVCRRINKSRWWVRGERLAGRFPEPVKTGGFVESEIDDYMERLIAERDADTAA